MPVSTEASDAILYEWSSVSGVLSGERVSHLRRFLVGKKILDAGCGGGGYVAQVSSDGFNVTGVDLSETLLFGGRQRAGQGVLVLADIPRLPFHDGAFDCTYCFDVLEHVDDVLAIRELARVTTDRLILAVPMEDTVLEKYRITFLHRRDRSHLREYSVRSLQQLVSAIGPLDIQIFPELPVNLQGEMRALVDLRAARVAPIEAYWLTAAAGLRRVVRGKLPRFWARYQEVCRRMSVRLLEEARYEEVYTSLVAVVDLRRETSQGCP